MERQLDERPLKCHSLTRLQEGNTLFYLTCMQWW